MDVPTRVSASLGNLGNIALRRGDYATARGLFEEALALNRRHGMELGVAANLCNLGIVAYVTGENEVALSLLDESKALATEHQSLYGRAIVEGVLGEVLVETWRLREAAMTFRSSLEHAQELRAAELTAGGLEGIAFLAARAGNGEAAARLLGAASSIRRAENAAPPDIGGNRERTYDLTRRLLEPSTFDELVAEGETADDDAVAMIVEDALDVGVA